MSKPKCPFCHSTTLSLPDRLPVYSCGTFVRSDGTHHQAWDCKKLEKHCEAEREVEKYKRMANDWKNVAEVLRKALSRCSTSCATLHHCKAEQHEYDEVCKPGLFIEAAIATYEDLNK